MSIGRDGANTVSTIVALFQRARRVVLAGTELLVEHNHATDVVANHLAVVDEVAGVLFLFYLLVDEQVEEEENARDLVRQATMIGDHIGGMIMLDKELGAREYHTPSPLK